MTEVRVLGRLRAAKAGWLLRVPVANHALCGQCDPRSRPPPLRRERPPLPRQLHCLGQPGPRLPGGRGANGGHGRGATPWMRRVGAGSVRGWRRVSRGALEVVEVARTALLLSAAAGVELVTDCAS